MSVVPFRFWMAIMVFFSAFSYYSMRVNLSVSIVSMTKGKTKEIPYCIKITLNDSDVVNNEELETNYLPDYGPRYDWSERIQGQILGSYFYGFLLSNIFAGALVETFGPFKIILTVNILSSIVNSSAVYAAHIHFGGLMVCRFILGVGGALVYPALQRFIAHWAPPNEKGKFTSCLMGNALGCCLTMKCVGLVTMNFGWDWGFHIISIENIIFSIIFAIVATDSPETHKWVTEEELKYIKEQQQGNVSNRKDIAPYKKIFTNIPCLMLILNNIANDWGLNLQFVLAPKFISEVIGYDVDEAGGFASIPPLIRMCFGMAFGLIGDYLISKEILRKVVVRKSSAVISLVIPGCMLILIGFMGCNFLPIIILLILSLGLNGAVVQNNLINAQDLAPNFAGTIYSLCNLFSSPTGFLISALNAEFTKEVNGVNEWAYTFILGGSAYCIGGTLWILFGSVEEQSFNREE